MYCRPRRTARAGWKRRAGGIHKVCIRRPGRVPISYEEGDSVGRRNGRVGM